MSEFEVLKREIVALRQQLEEKESALNALCSATNEVKQSIDSKQNLTNEEIGRYARQIILPEIGVKGQLALKNASILIVGAGGLGIVYQHTRRLSFHNFHSNFTLAFQVVHRHCIWVALELVTLASLTTTQSN